MTPKQKPRLATLPALLFAAGLGMVFFYGYSWANVYGLSTWQLPVYSEAEIEQSIDLNLAIDLQRGGSSVIDAGGLAARRDAVHAQVVAAVDEEIRTAREWRLYFLTGLILTAMGLAQMIILRRIATR